MEIIKQYLPFGELWTDQRATEWNSRYTFSGKEKDEETGYHYFGARYYDSNLGIWLSVDPKARWYPHLTPYNYVGNDPINYTDPNGEFKTKFGAWIYKVFNGGGKIEYSKDRGEWYVGKDVPYKGPGIGVAYQRIFNRKESRVSGRGGVNWYNRNARSNQGAYSRSYSPFIKREDITHFPFLRMAEKTSSILKLTKFLNDALESGYNTAESIQAQIRKKNGLKKGTKGKMYFKPGREEEENASWGEIEYEGSADSLEKRRKLEQSKDKVYKITIYE